MSILKKLKGNIFLVVVIAAYIVMFIVRPDMGVESIKNSGYYIKEMLLIMPVIFILTALLDLWLPKEKVIRYLGKDSKAKGIAFSFILGSISAGPVYAAFPMCVMLHKKGASIRNIVIILSSWAVIKIPMLVNEAKFLGLKFMAIRWILTVIAIIIFSWITAKIVKDKDLPTQIPAHIGPSLNRDACMGCGLCVKHYPEMFVMDGKKADINKEIDPDPEKLKQTIDVCPVKAISNQGYS
ncbi:permease [Christensenellaceae bacterium OttesenSCG-928-K19]|uniref:permease n=1 Tax=Christensenella minuta TaxID=626937 RepID=UPI0021586339|nr:permease [Christensenella minuta]MDL2238398.1 permease [Christensenellaceae bacterium OttesenSCG-928-K19]